MSKKSNHKRTQNSRKAKRHQRAGSVRVGEPKQDVLAQQEDARKAYREVQSQQRKRTFTTGVKALIASAAIMLMFFAGILSWSLVSRMRRNSDTEEPAADVSTHMVTESMVTGIPRKGRSLLESVNRFAGFMSTPNGLSGQAMFGGRVSAYQHAQYLKEADILDKEWQQHEEERKKQLEDASLGGFDQMHAEAAKRAKESESTADAVKVVTQQDVKDEDHDKSEVAPSTKDSDADEDEKDNSTTVTDKQIKAVIDSAKNASSR